MKISLVIGLACCASLGMVGMRNGVVGGHPVLEEAPPAEGAPTAAPLPSPAPVPRLPEALPAGAAAQEPVPTLEPVLATEPARVSTAEAERIARRFYHAQVEVEELERALPPDEPPHLRSREALPVYFAAVDGLGAARVPFSSLPPPGPEELLPTVDLSAEGDDFERIYRGWSREDLLVENWRISRAAYAESQRLFELRFAQGRYEVGRLPVQRGWG